MFEDLSYKENQITCPLTNELTFLHEIGINIHTINVNNFFEEIFFEQILENIKNINNFEKEDEKINLTFQFDINSNYLGKKRKKQKKIYHKKFTSSK